MVVKRVWLLPVAASFCGFTAMIAGYTVGVSLGHFPKVFPFISDMAILAPEGCLFAQLLNTSAFFIILTSYMRHRQTVEYYGHRLHWENSKWRQVSLFFMWTGIVTAVGVTVVASFPDNEVHSVHQFAAGITFLAGLLYSWGQVLIGYCMIPRMASNLVNALRVLLCSTATIAAILYGVALNIRPFSSKSSLPLSNRLVASLSEWIGVAAVLCIFLSFAAELRFAYAHAPRVVFRRTSTDSEVLQVPSTSGIQQGSW